VRIKKGSFAMGSKDGDSDEKPVHNVTIANDFYLGKFPVTIAEYLHFVNETKKHYPQWLDEGSEYHKDTGTNDWYTKMDLSDNAPVIGVSWDDANAYCEWLSKKTKEDYRLPTEAEWEYAARAGTKKRWSFGDDEKGLDEYAWYSKNSESKTHPVGKKKPNPWGLYDIHGNVWEWCEDDFVDSYKETPRDGKAHIDGKADYKVVRGGSWGSDADWTRSAIRSRNWPSIRYFNLGFRLLRTLP